MPLPREHLLDELATAYVQALAALAGATIAVSRRDYGVDGTLSQVEQVRIAQGVQFIPSGFPVDFQLKGTTVASVQEERVQYDLKVRNYDLIVGRPALGTPYYLFLVCFDGALEEWFALKPNELILKASAFWHRRKGSKDDRCDCQPTGRRADVGGHTHQIFACDGMVCSFIAR
jgi:Domain of unknown function (DUF4365)